MQKERIRTTVAVAANLLAAVDAAVKKGAARSRNEFLETALRNQLAADKRKEIDAAFAEMGGDADYQREACQVAEEFAASDWEAWQASEKEN